nr:uncharacterized protein LOC107441723 [Parasteatoda tepidariorum]
MITETSAKSQKKIQESDAVANHLDHETSEATSESDLSNFSVQLCCSSSADVADLFETAGTTASFQLEVIETATKDLARKIKNETKNHCAKIKEMGMDEIINKRRPSSEVLKECSQMITETIQSMEEQLHFLIDCKKSNMRLVKDYVLKDIADSVEKSLEPEEKMLFDHKNAGVAATVCRKSVMTIHLFLECFFVFGAYVYACKKSIIPFYF